MTSLRDTARKIIHGNARLYYLTQRARTGVKLKIQAPEHWNSHKMVPLWRLYLSTLKDGLQKRRLFETVTAYCMFVGHERSGHSLVGAILDAHPEVIVSHEQNALALFSMGFSVPQVFSLLLESSRQGAAIGRGESGYNYQVPNQWQGKFSTLRVIGDKDARRDTANLTRYPELLQRVRKTLGVPLRVIHVTRNPFDNIATIQSRNKHEKRLDDVMNRYFAECETIQGVCDQLKDSLIVSRHEDFIADPKKEIVRLCTFLGVNAPVDYLAASAGIVRPSAHRSRSKISWTNEQVRRVEDAIQRYEFLAGYTFAS